MPRNKPSPTVPQSLRILAEILEKDKEKAGGYEPLQDRIRKHGRHGALIERRKLQSIVGKKTSCTMTFAELEALSSYLLKEHRISLASLFETSVLENLVATGSILFLLGAQPRKGRTDVSRWDLMAMQEVFSRINQLSGSLKIDSRLIVNLRGRKDADASWISDFERDSATARISIGSQRACRATELILARMFRLEPFKRDRSRESSLPFQFIWPDERIDSEFVKPVDGEAPPSQRKRRRHRSTGHLPWGLEVNGMRYDLERFVPNSKTFAIVAAQRHGTQAWLVIAGLSGPGTFAAAKVLTEEPRFMLPDAGDSEAGPVVWMAVEADVVIRPEVSGDKREVKDWRRFAGPEIWPPG